MRKLRTSASGARPEGTVVVRTVAVAFVLASGCEMSAWAGDSLGSKLIAPRMADASGSPLRETITANGKRAVETKITPVPTDTLDPVEEIIGPYPSVHPCPLTKAPATIPVKPAKQVAEETAEVYLEDSRFRIFRLIGKLISPVVAIFEAAYEFFYAEDGSLSRIDGTDEALRRRLYNLTLGERIKTEPNPCK
jgi:hypothetical protein